MEMLMGAVVLAGVTVLAWILLVAADRRDAEDAAMKKALKGGTAGLDADEPWQSGAASGERGDQRLAGNGKLFFGAKTGGKLTMREDGDAGGGVAGEEAGEEAARVQAAEEFIHSLFYADAERALAEESPSLPGTTQHRLVFTAGDMAVSLFSNRGGVVNHVRPTGPTFGDFIPPSVNFRATMPWFASQSFKLIVRASAMYEFAVDAPWPDFAERLIEDSWRPVLERMCSVVPAESLSVEFDGKVFKISAKEVWKGSEVFKPFVMDCVRLAVGLRNRLESEYGGGS